MPKQTRQEQLQTRLEQAKRKLKLGTANPFEKARANVHHKVLNKRDNEEKPLNHVQTQSEVEIRKNLADAILQKQETKQFAISADEEVYNEVAQKSKQFRQERKQANEQVEKNVEKFDKYAQQIASILPPREFEAVQQRLEVDGDVKLVQPQKLKITQFDAIRTGAARLEELQRERREELCDLNLGGDDDDFGDIKSDISEVSEFSDFSDAAPKQERPGLTDETDNLQPIEQIPYILAIPETYKEFERLMNKVSTAQEIVLYDRLIKMNSTALDAKNAPDCERLAEFALRRFVSTHNATKMDCAMRCLRHLATELPVQVSEVFKTYFMGYKKVQPVQFAIVLRLYSTCFVSTDFLGQPGNVAELAFLCAEAVACSLWHATDMHSKCQLLFLCYQIALFSVNCLRFTGVVLSICDFLLSTTSVEAFNYEEESTAIDIMQLLMAQKGDLFESDTAAARFIRRGAEAVARMYCATFQIHGSLLKGDLSAIAPLQISRPQVIQLIRDAPPQIQELDPVFAVHYNPKRGLGADVELARQRAKTKADVRKTKDAARKRLREARADIAARQVRAVDKRDERRRALNAVEGFYQEEVSGIKTLNKLEKLNKRSKK